MKRSKVALVGSSGGHLAQLFALRDAWASNDHFWVTFGTEDARSLLTGERAYWCYHPTNRNLRNLLRNTLLAIRILIRERPTVIISTGAAVAIPFFWIGKLLGATTVFIEVIDRFETPSITGRVVTPIANHVLVQWSAQQSMYGRSSTLVGPLL